MARHPGNAVFVSGDGRVSFDENGRKLDSNGNVVWGDRQSLRGANARVRPEIIEAYRQEEQAQQQAQTQPPAQQYRPPAVAQPPMQQPASPWAGVSDWGAPAMDWNRFTPPQAQRPPAPPQWGWNDYRPQPRPQAQPQPQPASPWGWNMFKR